MDSDKMRFHAHQAALYLDHVRGMGVQVKMLNLSIAELEAKAEGVNALDYSKDLVQTSPTDDTMPNAVAELIKQKRDREAKRDLYAEELASVTRVLGRMPNKVYAAILDAHYIGEASWGQIADEYPMSKRGIMKVRQKALAMFYDHMPPSQRFIDVPKAL